MEKTENTQSVQQVIAAIQALDLDAIKFKTMDRDEGYGWSREQADHNEVEYKRFLTLLVKYPETTIAPNKTVDKFWHAHILDTMKYADDCQKVFGYFLHHFPYFGMRGAEDAANLAKAGEATARLYQQEFSTAKPDDAAYCGASTSYCGAAVTKVEAKTEEAAYCGASTSYCGAAVTKVEAKTKEAAYCGASTSYCGAAVTKVEAKTEEAAYCGASTSYCGAAVTKVEAKTEEAAYCGASTSYCGAAVTKVEAKTEEAAYCGASTSYCGAAAANKLSKTIGDAAILNTASRPTLASGSA